jgi:hypothetical protein
MGRTVTSTCDGRSAAAPAADGAATKNPTPTATQDTVRVLQLIVIVDKLHREKDEKHRLSVRCESPRQTVLKETPPSGPPSRAHTPVSLSIFQKRLPWSTLHVVFPARFAAISEASAHSPPRNAAAIMNAMVSKVKTVCCAFACQ